MEPNWWVLNVREWEDPIGFEAGDRVVLVATEEGQLQATIVEVQTSLDPDRDGLTEYTGKTLDDNVLPIGSVTKFDSRHAVKPVPLPQPPAPPKNPTS